MYILQYLKTRTMEKTLKLINKLLDLTGTCANTKVHNDLIEIKSTLSEELSEIIKQIR